MLIHPSLNWTWEIEFIIEYDLLIIIESHSIYNNIGESGATSLSEGLKVNSSLTQLDLWIEFIVECDWLIIIESHSI